MMKTLSIQVIVFGLLLCSTVAMAKEQKYNCPNTIGAPEDLKGPGGRDYKASGNLPGALPIAPTTGNGCANVAPITAGKQYRLICCYGGGPNIPNYVTTVNATSCTGNGVQGFTCQE